MKTDSLKKTSKLQSKWLEFFLINKKSDGLIFIINLNKLILMKYVKFIVCLLFGLMFINAGMDKFFH